VALIPYVIETTPRGERGMDIYSRLLRERIMFIGTGIDETIANIAVAQLLLLRSEDPDRDIMMYINSPGGSVHAGLAIYDTMQYIMGSGNCKIHTYCYGSAMSFGTVLLTGGAKGCRYALPNSTIHIHQPWQAQGRGGQASDIEIEAREILRLRSKLNDILCKHTGQPLERIQRDTDRDYFMTAQQALEYGLIDGIISEGSDMAGLPGQDGGSGSLPGGGTQALPDAQRSGQAAS
jgi:ATP-dependent Clp protease, protease subunit